MKVLYATLPILSLATAAAVTNKANYDDWKVYRVNTGSSDTAKLTEIVKKLQLQPWKGNPESSALVDVMVPPSKVSEFEASTVDIETQIMHQNLGLSIADEEAYEVYAGT
jgi:carboxypeptidase A4